MTSPTSSSPVLLVSTTSTPPTSTPSSPEILQHHNTAINPIEGIFSSSPSPPPSHIHSHNFPSSRDIERAIVPTLTTPAAAGAAAATSEAPWEQLLSDLPALRRQHVMAGYREGLAISKAKTIQHGFDAGYPIGVGIGVRAGLVLGVIEGIVSALERGVTKDKETDTSADEKMERVVKMLQRARREVGELAGYLVGVTDEDLGVDMKEQAGNGTEKANFGIATGISGAVQTGTSTLAQEAVVRLEFWERALYTILPKITT